ncbi:MAG: hypothetical protein WA510_27385, partial [Acidobacteriaceae bacterium]
MRRMYFVVAKNQPRGEARVLQVLDHQQVCVLVFLAHRYEEELHMTIIVEADAAKADRIESLLRRLQATLRVD